MIDPATDTAMRRLHIFGVEGERHTGAGRIQQALDEHLPACLPPNWKVETENGAMSMRERLLKASDADATVWICTPLPVRRPSARHAHFVFDLRWRTTRGPVARLYRQADLRRIAKHADRIFAISEHMATEIRAATGGRTEVTVVPMGPGQVESRPLRDPSDTHSILLMGRAPHKRNEEVAALLSTSATVRSAYRILAVSVSAETEDLLRSSSLEVEFFANPDANRFGEILERSSVYVGLSVDEGFGLPFAEAAYCGADVVAVDLPVAREALGDHGNFLPNGPLTVAQLEGALERWDHDRVLALRDEARRRSWTDCADAVAAWVQQTDRQG